MFNLAAIPSYSTGNSTEQDLQEQVGRQGTTNHVRGRFSNETTDQRERRLHGSSRSKAGERVSLKLLAKIYNLYIYIYIFLNTKENPICTIKLMSNFK